MEIENNKIQLNSEFILQFLSKILIDEYVLFLKTKNAFWNFECNIISTENNLFERQTKEIDSLIDHIAKQIIILNNQVLLTYNEVATRLKNTNKKEFANELLADNLHLIKTIKEWNTLMPLSGYYDIKNIIQKLIAKHQILADELRIENKKFIEHGNIEKR